MRTNWSPTCLGLMLLGPLLTACGGNDDGATTEAATTTSAESSSTPSPGVYGQPLPDAPEPSDVVTDPPAPTSAPGADVVPRLTYFGWNADIGAVEAGGIVPAIVESGGTCTLTMSLDAAEVTASSEAIDNVTSTSCSEMIVTGDRLSPGAWQAVLTYESETSQGASEAVQIEVP